VEPADRIVVEPLEGWLTPLPESIEISGRARIQELIATVTIDQEKSDDVCACHGDTLIHFYADDKHLVTVSHHHGTHLRWLDGPWLGDGMLSSESQESFPKWFAKNGYDGFARLKEKEG